MKPVIIHPEAEAEIETAADYLEASRARYGEKFRAEVATALRQVGATPAVFSEFDGGPARRYLLNRFRYSVFFVELDDAVHVVSVAHQSRQPGYWLDRLDDI